MNEIWLQLWSGTIGAVVGAVVGAVSAIAVLYLTNKHQTRLAKEALARQTADSAKLQAEQRELAEKQLATQLSAQRELAEAQLAVQRELANAQLAAQRDERRQARELQAIGELLQFTTQVVRERPEGLDFVPELGRLCDQLTLNSSNEAGQHWRNNPRFDRFVGAARHPYAEFLAVTIAIAQLMPNVSTALAENRLGLSQRDIRRVLPRHNWQSVEIAISTASERMLQWLSLSDQEKVDYFARKRDWSRGRASDLVTAVGLLSPDDERELKALRSLSLPAKYDSHLSFVYQSATSLVTGGIRTNSEEDRGGVAEFAWPLKPLVDGQKHNHVEST